LRNILFSHEWWSHRKFASEAQVARNKNNQLPCC
jgi:hypothetical protein